MSGPKSTYRNIKDQTVFQDYITNYKNILPVLEGYYISKTKCRPEVVILYTTEVVGFVGFYKLHDDVTIFLIGNSQDLKKVVQIRPHCTRAKH